MAKFLKPTMELQWVELPKGGDASTSKQIYIFRAYRHTRPVKLQQKFINPDGSGVEWIDVPLKKTKEGDE